MTATSPPSVPDITPSHERRLLWGFVAFNALFRLALIGLNEGAYTDGIIQITQFERNDSFWPPLFGAVVWCLRSIGVEGILAGRLVAWASAVGLVFPVWAVARRWGGVRAALFATALYTMAPLPLRWSNRAMTDLPFVFLFHSACALWLGYWVDRTDQAGRGAGTGRTRVVWLTVLSVAATLTRYQGAMLAPLVWWTVWDMVRGRRPGRWGAVAVQVFWLALPAWVMFHRFGHVTQVLERQSAGDLGQTLLNYWFFFESFLYIVPYVLTLPVFGFLAYGLIRGGRNAERIAPVRWLLFYVSLAVLVAQSVFQSFQTRYLLPLLPLALVVAGMGMARAEAALSERGRWGHRAFLAMSGTTFAFSLVFALAVVMAQKGAFGDIFAAGRALREMELPPGTRIFSNEVYRPGMHGIKLAYASGHSVEVIPNPRKALMPPGSVVALHSAYYGGASQHGAVLSSLQRVYELRALHERPFHSWLVPLLPDIMERFGTHQSPLAWGLRYQPQYFQSELFVVVGPAPGERP